MRPGDLRGYPHATKPLRQDRRDAGAGQLHQGSASASWPTPGPTCSASISAMAATTTMPRASPCCARSSRSVAGRSARSWTCRGPSCGSAASPTAGSRLARGDHFRLDLDKAQGDQHRATLPHPEIFAVLQPGQDLLLDDGRIRLQVERCGPRFRRDARWSTAAACPTARASTCPTPCCRSRP